MAGDDVAKVLDLERPFESGRKEAAEGSDDGGEEGEEEGVDKEGEEGDRLLHVQQPSPCGQCLHKFLTSESLMSTCKNSSGHANENLGEGLLLLLEDDVDKDDGDGDSGTGLRKGVLLLAEDDSDDEKDDDEDDDDTDDDDDDEKGEEESENLWKSVFLLAEKSRGFARHCHPLKLT